MNNTYKCYLICLKDIEICKNQKIELKESLKKFNLNYKIFDAIKGKEGYNILNDFLERHNLKEKKFEKKLIEKHKEGRIGCLASHLILWEKCIKKNINLLILENDVIMLDDVDYIIKNINKKDLIILDPYNPYSLSYDSNINDGIKKEIKILDGHTKRKNYNSKGAYCYYITTKGAEKIINFIKKSDTWMPADYYLDDKILKIGTVNKTIFRINENYPSGIYSFTGNLKDCIKGKKANRRIADIKDN